jgi:hypothetical protein
LKPWSLARRLLTPSLADCLFAAMLVWLALFTISGKSAGLLHDSNTALHIRTGDYILEHHSVPQTDIFSFTRFGQPWYAWEWLAGVWFALLHQWAGLKGLGCFAAAAIGASTLTVLGHLLWRGANFLVAILALHLLVAASSLHYLARPHVFTLLFFAAAMWALDADRRTPSRRIWLLIPLTALWANLHGAFAAWIGTAALVAAGYALVRDWERARRYGILAAACLGVSGINPYGFKVHLHILDYMRQTWIVDLVEEFQAVKFHEAAGRYFEALLIASLFLAAKYAFERRAADALVILAWAHLSLQSARHVPMFAIAVIPPLAAAATALWNRWTDGAPARSMTGILSGLARDHAPHLRRVSLWSVAAVAGLATAPLHWPTDFSDTRFPVTVVSRNLDRLAAGRVFSPDSWGDYLTYRNYPRQRVFVDGRSDFFGKDLFDDYLRTLRGHHGWDFVLDKYQVDLVLAPCSTAILSVIGRDARWRLVDQDGLACLAERIKK